MCLKLEQLSEYVLAVVKKFKTLSCNPPKQKNVFMIKMKCIF